jgi:hypothetical protein
MILALDYCIIFPPSIIRPKMPKAFQFLNARRYISIFGAETLLGDSLLTTAELDADDLLTRLIYAVIEPN